MIATMAKAPDQLTEKLNRIASKRGLTQAQIASACGVSQTAIHRYFSGSAPRAHTLLILAEVLEVDPVWLADESKPFRDDYPRSRAEGLDTDRLAEEIIRRFSAKIASAHEALDAAEQVDFGWLASRLNELRVNDLIESIPEEITAGVNVLSAIYAVGEVISPFTDELRMGRWPTIGDDGGVSIEGPYHEVQRRARELFAELRDDPKSGPIFKAKWRDSPWFQFWNRAAPAEFTPENLASAVEGYRAAGGKFKDQE